MPKEEDQLIDEVLIDRLSRHLVKKHGSWIARVHAAMRDQGVSADLHLEILKFIHQSLGGQRKSCRKF